MARNLRDHMSLASAAPLDSIFSTEESRQDAKLQKVFEIPITELSDFPDHPYKVRDDDAMTNLTESVKNNGVQVPAIVRPHPEGGYEMVSGHRRKRAAILAGYDTVPCIVKDLSDDDAIILMVESNFQRDELLPSEKAFAYKMRLEAMHRLAGRPSKDNPAQIGLDLRGKQSRDILAEKVGESRSQIQRTIRLTELEPSLLDMVDNKQFALNAAVEISYMEKPLQEQLLQAIEQEECAPTLAQAKRLRHAAEAGTLDQSGMLLVLSEEKPIEDKVVLKGERFNRFLPKGYTPKQKEVYIMKALEYYQRHREKQREPGLAR